MNSLLDWNDLRYVLAVATEGSLSGAARRLGVNHSTVFRRLGQIEERLGVRLLERLRDGYAPTPAGEAAVALATRMAEEISTLERRLAGEDLRPAGTLRVTTTDPMLGLLTPMFAAFRHEQPRIELEVIVANQFLSLSRRDADVAIRPSSTPPGNLFGRRLSGVSLAIYGRGDLFAGKSRAEAVAECRWAGLDESLMHLASAAWLRRTVPGERIVYRTNTLIGLVEAARAGIGVAVVPCFLGDREAGLRRIGDPLPELATELWLLIHEDLRNTARVRSFVDFMSRAIRLERPRLEGRPEASRASTP